MQRIREFFSELCQPRGCGLWRSVLALKRHAELVEKDGCLIDGWPTGEEPQPIDPRVTAPREEPEP